MRYEDEQIAELRWKGKGPNAVLGQYHRHNDPELDWWKVTGREGFVNPDDVEVVKTFVLIPVEYPLPPAAENRPSTKWILVAQEALRRAIETEEAAGNPGHADMFNSLILVLFGAMIRSES